MDDVRTTYVMTAFIIGWTKCWDNVSNIEVSLQADVDFEVVDVFRANVMSDVESKAAEEYNRALAELFGVIVTQVKTFPTQDGTWLILDKHTKRMLYKGIKNENEVDYLCKKHNYLR